MKLVKEACRAANAADFIEELDEVTTLIMPAILRMLIYNRAITQMSVKELACSQEVKNRGLPSPDLSFRIPVFFYLMKLQALWMPILKVLCKTHLTEFQNLGQRLSSHVCLHPVGRQ